MAATRYKIEAFGRLGEAFFKLSEKQQVLRLYQTGLVLLLVTVCLLARTSPSTRVAATQQHWLADILYFHPKASVHFKNRPSIYQGSLEGRLSTDFTYRLTR
jgi:hypothetical protein